MQTLHHCIASSKSDVRPCPCAGRYQQQRNMSSHSLTFVQAPPRLSRLFTRCPRFKRAVTCSIDSRSSVSSPSSSAASLSTIPDLVESVKSGHVTASDNLARSLRRISCTDGHINAFLTVDVERAQRRAAEIDDAIASGRETGILAGVPIAIKDNICTKDIPTTAASRILDGFIPAHNATAVARLEAAGAVILGKTNMDEFGMGSTTELSAYGETRNPCDLHRVPGGSSGGSAAAVASGACVAALGTDTGGSIRLPAAFCGVTGLRPSYGRVSRYGLLAYASSFDTIGPICNCVLDAALILSVIAGHDPLDATSVDDLVPDYLSGASDPGLSSIRVGLVREALGEGVDPHVVSAVRTAVDQLTALGATVDEVSLPRLDVCVPAYYVLAMSEASANLARYDGVRYGVRHADAQNCNDLYSQSRTSGFGEEVKRRIMAGTFALSSGYYDAYYRSAQRVRRLMTDDLNNVFNKGFDVLVMPVSTTPAFKFGEKVDNPISMYLADVMNLPSSLAGFPSISVPCGVTPDNLPVGLQVIAPYLRDETVLRVAHAFQDATSHHIRTNSLVENALTVPA